MSAATVMEHALRNDVAACEVRVRLATPKPVISKGKLIHRGNADGLHRAERDLRNAQLRLERWLEDHNG